MKKPNTNITPLLVMALLIGSCQHDASKGTMDNQVENQTSMKTQPTGILKGTVKTTLGDPISGAAISISSTTSVAPIRDISPVSNSKGEFTFRNLPPGDYVFKASHFGHKTVQQKVTITADASSHVDFTLLPQQ